MTVALPQAVVSYFQAANAHDSADLVNWFTEDAVVYDEAHVYRGITAIQEWNETVSKQYALTLQVVSAAETEQGLSVVAQASGNFEGSPASITHHFTLNGQKITSLRCE